MSKFYYTKDLQERKRRAIDSARALDYGCIRGRHAVHGVIGPGGMSCKRTTLVRDAGEIGGRRGEIRGFSRAAQRRMRHRLMVVDWTSQPSFFVGLTYHEDWPDPEGCQAHLKALRKRLERHFGGAFDSAIWKKEYAKRRSGARRGDLAPHFHLVLFFTVQVPVGELFLWLLRAWNDIAAPGDGWHRAHGSHVEEVHKSRGVDRLMAYLCKYLSKEIEVDFPTGRMWGVWGDLPVSAQVFRMGYRDFCVLCRRLRAYGKAHEIEFWQRLNGGWKAFLLYGSGDKMRRLLRGLPSVQMC